MSGAACKAALCLGSASQVAQVACTTAQRDEQTGPRDPQVYTDQQYEAMAAASDQFTARMVEIVERGG